MSVELLDYAKVGVTRDTPQITVLLGGVRIHKVIEASAKDGYIVVLVSDGVSSRAVPRTMRGVVSIERRV